jgi:hypothetical protein
MAFDGKHLALPSVNGMTGREYLQLIKEIGFQVEYLRSTPILERYRVLGGVGAALNRALTSLPPLEEPLSFNLVSILRK